MTILEALETGLFLRRPIPKHLGDTGDGWISPNFIKNTFIENNPLIDFDDFIAKDWEVKDKEVIITKAVFKQHFNNAIGVVLDMYQLDTDTLTKVTDALYDSIVEDLGL